MKRIGPVSMAPVQITRTRYPVHPGGDALKLYNRLFDEAQYLNRARGQYKGIVVRQKAHISQLQAELAEFREESELTLRQKAELNKIVHGYGQSLKQLETAEKALEEAFEENGAWGVLSVSTLVEAVRAFIQTFRLAMDQAKEIRLAGREPAKEVVGVDS